MEKLLIRIVGSDIGGTLTDRDGKISNYTLRVMNALPVPLCLVTGFNRHVAFYYRDRFSHPDLYLIAQNGAFGYHGDRLLFSRLVDPADVRLMVDFLLRHGCVARVFCVDNNVYCIRPETHTAQVLRWDDPIYRFHEGPLESLPPVIQVCAFEPISVIAQVLVEAQCLFGRGCIIGSRLYGTHQWLELSHPLARKEESFPELLGILGIQATEAMFCGDNFNDLDVLQHVGYPVVVSDAPDEVKRQVSTVAGPGYDDGIAQYLNQLFDLGIEFEDD